MAEPFFSVGHPATKRLLDQILPGKKVGTFSLHFPIQGVATIRAEILLSEQDLEELTAIAEEYELTAQEPDCVMPGWIVQDGYTTGEDGRHWAHFRVRKWHPGYWWAWLKRTVFGV